MLVDTNLLLRTLQPLHEHYRIAGHALRTLLRRGEQLQVVPQNLFELWVVATRPAEQNGLGMSVDAARLELNRIKGMFVFMPDTPDVYELWEELVCRHEVVGKTAHDARLVAAMRAHRISTIVTFDRSGFVRYEGIQVIHPLDAVG